MITVYRIYCETNKKVDQCQLAGAFGVIQSNINCIVNGKSWAHI